MGKPLWMALALGMAIAACDRELVYEQDTDTDTGESVRHCQLWTTDYCDCWGDEFSDYDTCIEEIGEMCLSGLSDWQWECAKECNNQPCDDFQACLDDCGF